MNYLINLSDWTAAHCYRAKEFFAKANQAAAFGRRARGRDAGNFFKGCPVGRFHARLPYTESFSYLSP